MGPVLVLHVHSGVSGVVWAGLEAAGYGRWILDMSGAVRGDFGE